MDMKSTRDATVEEAVDAANAVSDDYPTESTLSQAISETLNESLYMADNSPLSRGGITLSPEQTGVIVRAALSGAMESLSSLDSRDFE